MWLIHLLERFQTNMGIVNLQVSKKVVTYKHCRKVRIEVWIPNNFIRHSKKIIKILINNFQLHNGVQLEFKRLIQIYRVPMFIIALRKKSMLSRVIMEIPHLWRNLSNLINLKVQSVRV